LFRVTTLTNHGLDPCCHFFHFSTATAPTSEGLPDSIKRVGETIAFPDEKPGDCYAFNWCLNGDGVTPLHGSAFRISKPLDLKVAGLSQPKINPLEVSYITQCMLVGYLIEELL
jgi:hypothetical protein